MSGVDAGLLVMLVPLLVLALLALKMGVVLMLLRQALPGALPRPVVAVLALLLSALVMAPVATRCQEAASGAGDAGARLARAAAPLGEFLRRHTPAHELQAVQALATASRGQPAEADLSVLLPAFALAELRAALEIGCLLLLPFLLLDLLCAALLRGLGLAGLSPMAVALPFKLLLFALSDGFTLLARALALGYRA